MKLGGTREVKKSNQDLINVLVCFGILLSVATVIVAIITKVEGFPVSTDNVWIGYYGSLIGGVITLVGVVLTLSENRKQNQENIEQLNKPVLIFNFEYQQGGWAQDRNKQFINGNFNDAILLTEHDSDANVTFATEISLENASAVALNVMFEVYVDGIIKYEKNPDFLIAIDKKPFYYYINTFQKDYNEKHEVIFKVFFEDMLGHQYSQELNYHIIDTEIKDVKVKKPIKI